MESTSLPNKIQASEDTANLLRQFPEFIVEERGEFDVKGKGKMKTYWIVGTNT
ncbi:hypothetical protein D917_06787 [Trichinella nativa]|nr:hypothetical protein D917_06787 [Trichinella nativa]